MNQFTLKKILLLSSFFILLLCLHQLFFTERFSNLFQENSFEQEMEEEEGGMALQDRIDLAMQQEFEMTKDPATGRVPRERLLIARDTLLERQKRNSRQLRTSASIAGINWTERGPNNSGGRTRAIWVDMNDATGKTIWTGSVGGGLWKTTDITVASPVWTPINDFFANLAITDITQNPLNTQEMYFSTGEAYFNADYIRGLGVFKSTDGGATWNQLAATATPGGNFAYIYRTKVNASGTLFVATYFNGLYRSTNGGATFTKVLGNGTVTGATSNRCFDIEFAANGDIYASLNGSIHKSTDGGVTFGAAMTLPMAASRIELATAPNDANYVYALTQSTVAGQTSNVGSIIRTTDAGTTWTSLSLPADADSGVGAADFSRGQAWYDLAIAVDPNDKNTAYVGAIDLFKTSNGGSSWNQISHWYGGFGYQNVHADNHIIYFQPGSSNVFYVGNDGGIYRSANGAVATPTISYRGAGYRTIQFYGCAMHPTAGSNFFLAGAQDNGSHKFNTAGLGPTTSASGGDGAFCNIDQDQPAYMWTQYVYNTYYRSTNGGTSFSGTGISPNANGRFINPSDYDNTSNTMYAGDNAGQYLSWTNPQTAANSAGCVFTTPTIADFSGAKVTAVTCSDATADLVFFGLDNADVVKITNASNASPTSLNISTGLPASGTVSCIALERGNENHMLVTYSNYGVNSIWESSNGGTTWTSVEGNLPDMPVRWAMFNPLDGTQALIATELGVWSTDLLNGASTNWGPSNTGLANVRTDMLQWRVSDKLVIASTHGRGLFSTTIFSAAPVTWLSFDAKKSGSNAILDWVTASETNNAGFEIERSVDGSNFTKIGYILPEGSVNTLHQYAYTDYTTKQGKTYYYRIRQVDKDGHFDYSNIVLVVMDNEVSFDFDQVYPNPFSNQLQVSFTANDNASIQIQLRNVESKIVYETSMDNGSKTLTLNLDHLHLPVGTYFLMANKQGEVVSKKIMKVQ